MMISIVSQDGLNSITFSKDSFLKMKLSYHNDNEYWVLTINNKSFGQFKFQTVAKEILLTILGQLAKTENSVIVIPKDSRINE